MFWLYHQTKPSATVQDKVKGNMKTRTIVTHVYKYYNQNNSIWSKYKNVAHFSPSQFIANGAKIISKHYPDTSPLSKYLLAKNTIKIKKNHQTKQCLQLVTDLAFQSLQTSNQLHKHTYTHTSAMHQTLFVSLKPHFFTKPKHNNHCIAIAFLARY